MRFLVHDDLIMRRRIQRTPSHICSLRSFRTLDNFEFNGVPFVQGFVSLAYDCRVMDKDIWTVIAPDEAVAFRVIEPLDRAFHHSTAIHFMLVPQPVSQIPERTTPTCIFSSRRQLRRFFLLLFVQLSDSLDAKFRPNSGVRFIAAPPSCSL